MQLSEFYSRHTEAFENFEVENALMIGLLNRLKHNLHLFGDEDPRFFTHGDCFAMQTPPYNLILGHPFPLEQAINFAQHLYEQELSFPGILGEKEAVMALANAWSKLTNTTAKVDMNERVYRLDTVNSDTLNPPKEGLSFELATRSDLEIILQWLYQFSVEALPENQRPDDHEQFLGKQRDTILEAIEQGQFYLVKQDSEMITMARTPSQTIHGRLVNYVYTPPKYRRQGLATYCVAKLSQKILDDGYQFCILFTDLDNPTSNKIYQNIGYAPVVDFNQVKFT